MPDNEGDGGYPVGVRMLSADCDGCTTAIESLNWVMPFYGFTPGAWFTVEGKLWCNWNFDINSTRDRWRIEVLGEQVIGRGMVPSPVQYPQIIVQLNPITTTKQYVVRGQSRPGTWAYEHNYTWPFKRELPVEGFDDIYPPEWNGGKKRDSDYSVRIKLERDENDSGFNVYVDKSSEAFFVKDFAKTADDLTGVERAYAIRVLGMRRNTTKLWAFGFKGVPPEQSESAHLSTNSSYSSSDSTDWICSLPHTCPVPTSWLVV